MDIFYGMLTLRRNTWNMVFRKRIMPMIITVHSGLLSRAAHTSLHRAKSKFQQNL